MSRRSSLSGASPLTAARRASIGGATPNLASPSCDARTNRRGSLKDLAAAREATMRAAAEHQLLLQHHAEAFLRLLQAHTVADLEPSVRQLVDLDGSLKPIEGFETLLTSGIEAAPVYSLRKDGSKEYTGFLDVRDLVSAVIFVQTQPINEDDLIFTTAGTAEVPVLPATHGLDELADTQADCAAAAAAAAAAGAGAGAGLHADLHSSTSASTASSAVLSLMGSPRGPLSHHTLEPMSEEGALPASVPGSVSPAVPGATGASALSLAAALAAEELESKTTLEVEEDPESSSLLGGAKTAPITITSPVAANSPVAASSSALAGSPRTLSWDEAVHQGMGRLASLAHSHASLPTVSFASACSSSSSTTTVTTSSSGFSSPVVSGRSLSSHAHGSAGPGAPSSPPSSPGLITLTYLSRRNPFRAVRASSTLAEVAELFARGAHRVPVVDAAGAVTDIVSQAALIRFLHAHLADLGDTADAPVHRLDVGSRHVFTVETEQSALAAFVQMDQVRLSGLALVDADGALVGCTSSRDLKRFALDKGRLTLHQPVVDYLRQARGQSHGAQDQAATSQGAATPEGPAAPLAGADRHARLVTLRATATVGEVLRALAKEETNRVFLVDDDRHPARVVSLSDFAKLAVLALSPHH